MIKTTTCVHFTFNEGILVDKPDVYTDATIGTLSTSIATNSDSKTSVISINSNLSLTTTLRLTPAQSICSTPLAYSQLLRLLPQRSICKSTTLLPYPLLQT